MINYTDLPTVKEYYGIEHTADDSVIANMIIPQVTAIIDQTCNQVIAAKDYLEIRDGSGAGFGLYEMSIRCYPVNSIASVTIDGTVIPPSPDGIQSGWVLPSAKMSVQLINYIFTQGQSNIRIAYNAGYTVIPAEIQAVALHLVGLKYQQRRRIGIASQGVSGQQTVYEKDHPNWVSKILQNFTNTANFS